MKFIYILLSVLLLFSNFFVKIKAEPNYHTIDPPIVTEKWTNQWLSINYLNQDWLFLRFHYNPDDVDAYCIEKGVEMDPYADYGVKDYDEENLKQLAMIYRAVNDLGASDLYYMAGQLLIWDMFGHYRELMNEPNIAKAIEDINHCIENYQKIVSPNLVLKNFDQDGEIIIEDQNGIISLGYEIKCDQAKYSDLKIVQNEIHLKLKDPYLEKIELILKPKAELIDANRFELGKAYVATSSQTLFSYNTKIPINYGAVKFEYVLPKGDLIIEKYDEYNNHVKTLIGIDLYEAKINDNKIIPGRKINEEVIKSEDGIIKIDNLVYGKYFIVERLCPEYFEINNEYLLIDVNASNIHFKLFNEYRKNEVEIYKFDDNFKAIADVGFSIYDINPNIENELEYIYTLKNQQCADLKPILKPNEEIIIPKSDNYIFDNNKLKVLNKQIVNFDIAVLNNEFSLEGFKTLYTKKGLNIDALETLNIYNGTELIETDIELDDYVIEENSDYVELYYRFSYLNEDYIIKRYLSFNKDLEFETKVYKICHKAKIYVVEGEEFKDGLIPIKGCLLNEYKSDENGKILINDLKMKHEYLICESSKNLAYNHASVCEFIKNDQLKYQLKYQNKLRKLALVVYKLSADDKQILLDGAEFEVRYLNELNQLNDVEKYVSGCLHINLNDFNLNDSGDYYVEIASQRYILNNYLNIAGLKEGDYEIKLFNGNNDLLQTINKSFKKGAITVNDLNYGQVLEIKEIKAPIGYQLDENTYRFEVKINDLHQTINQYRINSIYIVKTNA